MHGTSAGIAVESGPTRARLRSAATGASFLFWLASSYALIQLSGIFGPYLEWTTRGLAALLRLAGEDAVATGNFLDGTRAQLLVIQGCDGIEPTQLLVAAVLATPVAWVVRLLGALLCAALLQILNYARLLSLYYAASFAPDSFDTLHIRVWQPLFLLGAALLFVAWMRRAARKPARAVSDARA